MLFQVGRDGAVKCSAGRGESGRLSVMRRGVSSFGSGGDLRVTTRLRGLAEGLITQDEHAVQRARILAEL